MNTFSFTVNNNGTEESKVAVYMRLLSRGIVEGTSLIFLLAFSTVMAALSISSAAVAVCMIGGINPYLLIPSMPYWCGAVFAFALIALSFSSAIGCRNLIIFARRFLRSWTRSHVRATEESLLLTASCPKVSVEKSVRRKKVILVSLAVFAVYFISAFSVSSISAVTMGFWHQWNWFVR